MCPEDDSLCIFLLAWGPVGGVSHPQSAAGAQDMYSISSNHFKKYPAVHMSH